MRWRETRIRHRAPELRDRRKCQRLFRAGEGCTDREIERAARLAFHFISTGNRGNLRDSGYELIVLTFISSIPIIV